MIMIKTILLIIVIHLFKVDVPNSSRLINANHFDKISSIKKAE